MRLTKKTASSMVRRHGELHALHGLRWKRLQVFEDALGSGDRSVRRRCLTHGGVPSGRSGVVPHWVAAQSRVSRVVHGALRS